MKASTTVAAVAFAVIVGTAGAARAVPEVSGVTMVQRENSRIVDVTYTLSGGDAIITLGIETNGVPLPGNVVTRLTGAVSKLIQPGQHTITWDAGTDWPENVTEVARAKVTAWSPDAPPLYCAVDLIGGTATNAYEVYYYPSETSVPGGVTNILYKTLRLLMRRISPTGGEGYTMGSIVTDIGRIVPRENPKQTILTKGYYIGIYEVTQGQWQQVMGDLISWPSKWNNNSYRLARPVERVSYDNIRGTSGQGGAGWPTNSSVYGSSFIGLLRTKTGNVKFDLPTEAQWEYACRAGTTGALNDGTVSLTNTTSDAQLAALGRYRWNGGKINGTTDPSMDCTTSNATATVGSYVPNAWGLYDMHGNVWELCLDWYGEDLLGGIDPTGPETSTLTKRVFRGGGWYNLALNCRSAYRDCVAPNVNDYNGGFRLVRTLP